MTRIHAYAIKRARDRFKAIRDLYKGDIPHNEIEELVHRALNDDVISASEGQDIMDFWETGELFSDISEHFPD